MKTVKDNFFFLFSVKAFNKGFVSLLIKQKMARIFVMNVFISV